MIFKAVINSMISQFTQVFSGIEYAKEILHKDMEKLENYSVIL
jgi:hypothetical protein